MQSAGHLKIWRNYYLILWGVLLYILAALGGNRYTFDGKIYVIVAENIASGKGILNQVGTELWQWPPLYPAILSVGYILGNINLYIWILHLFMLAVTYAVWLHIIKEELSDLQTGAIASMYIIFSAAILFCYVYVLSEALFLTTSAIYFYYITKWLRDSKPASLWLAAIAGFATLLSRNAGIFLFAGAFIYIFIHLWRQHNKKRITQFVLHLIIVLSGFAAWNIQKLWIGDRMHIINELLPRLDVWANWRLISKNIAAAFIPFALPQLFHSLFMVLIIIFISSHLWFRI